jgi:hypothetical protein
MVGVVLKREDCLRFETTTVSTYRALQPRRRLFFTKYLIRHKKKTKLHGPSRRANYTDRATAACRRSDANFCG